VENWNRPATDQIRHSSQLRMSESRISLNCYVLRDHSGNVFTLKISRTDNVTILKDLIKKKKAQLLAPVDLSDLDLFQVR